MTTTLIQSSPAPLDHYQRPQVHHRTSKPHNLLRDDDFDDCEASAYASSSYAASSCSSSSSTSYYMQNAPPFRSRMSATSIPRTNPPIPPSLLDSPLIVSPNSPFRREHGFAPSGPSYTAGHDRMNLLDQVPMGSSSRAGPSYPYDTVEPAPDDIGVAGTPRSARSSSINSRSTTLRPILQRGNSWLLQQQQADPRSSGVPPPHLTSPTQSILKLPSVLPGPTNNARLPLNTPYPPASSSSRGATGQQSLSSGAPVSSAGRPS